MRVVVQVVKQSDVVVDGVTTGKIGKGYMLLVGFNNNDDIKTVEKMAQKVANLRIFEDDEDKLNLSIKDVKGEILSISQFTLYGDARKGNRPSFTDALNSEKARPLYDKFNEILENDYQIKVEKGVFKAHMEVSLINNGPTTILLEL